MVHKGGQLVVQQVVVQGSAGLFVEFQLLGEAEADAHGHAAVDLGLRQGGVDEGSAVVDIDDVQQFHLAHGDVHLHLGKGAAEGVGVGLDLGRGLRGDVLAVLQGVEALGGQLAQSLEDPAVGLADDLAVHQIQDGHRHPGLLVGDLQDPLPQGLGCLHNREAADVRLPGGVGAGAEGGHVRVLGGHRVDVLHRDAHRVRHHLGVGGVAALADLRLAGLELEGAVLVQHHPAGGGLQGDWPHGGVVPEHRQAHAPPDGAGLVLVRPVFPGVVQQLHPLVHALVEGVGVQLVLGEAVGIAHRHQVLPPEFHGLHAEAGADVVDVALPGPHGLGDAVAPHGARHRAVGVHRPAVALQISAGVQLREGAHALGHDAVAVGGVAALVGPGLELPGHQRAVGPDPGDDVGADGVADPVGDEGLLPGALQVHQPAAHLGGEPGAQGLVQGVLLVAEAAADVGLHDPHLAPGQAQGLPHHPADDVGDLGGGDHHHPARLLIGEAAVVLDVAVLDRGGVVPALDPDQPRLLDGALIVAPPDVRVLQHVAGTVLVDLGGIRLHGLLGVQDEGQLLVLRLQGPEGLGRGHLILGDDGGDVVAVVPHMAVQQQPVRHVLVGGVRGPGVSRRGEGIIGHVEAGQDLHHAGDGLRLCGVDGLHIAVGNGGMQDPGHQGALIAQVRRVLGAARGFVIGVHAGDAFADAFAHQASLLFSLGVPPPIDWTVGKRIY